ncbi:MAG: DUF4080 domain-containing protein [Clostridia bacterium]|nr:DUF4080 domain-containing protein [Clostridia bacterium]
MKSLKTMLVAVNAKYVHTNIAVRYISQVCKEQGLDCGFCEFTINEPQFNIISKLYAQDCDAYGFSCYIWNIGTVLKLCKSLKKLRPERKIFLGGPDVSFDAEEILSENPFVDYIICGEGENCVADLIKMPPDERCVLYGERIEDMNLLPFPYADDDLKRTVKGEKLVYYETSRGCPFSCSYCLSSASSGVRFLPLERVKEEIERFVKSGAKTIKFVDRTFNADKNRAIRIWEHCLSLEGETCFHFEIGADLLSDAEIDLLKMAKPGQIQFEIGVQTTNQRTISEISRTMNLEKLAKNVSRLKNETNVMLHLDLIAGLPCEDFLSFKKSFNDVYNLSPDVLQLGFLKLLKGSALRKNAGNYGIEFCQESPYEVFFTNDLSFDDVIRLKEVEDVLERYFNSGRFKETLKKATGYFETPFDFYLELSGYWKAKDLFGQGVKRISLYSHLYEFLKDRLCEKELAKVMKTMKTEFEMWHSSGVGTPDWYKIY